MCSDVQKPYHLPFLCSIHQDSSLKSVRTNQHHLQESLCTNSASDPDSLDKPRGIESSNLNISECPTVLVGLFKSAPDQETKTSSWVGQGYLAVDSVVMLRLLSTCAYLKVFLSGAVPGELVNWNYPFAPFGASWTSFLCLPWRHLEILFHAVFSIGNYFLEFMLLSMKNGVNHRHFVIFLCHWFQFLHGKILGGLLISFSDALLF